MSDSAQKEAIAEAFKRHFQHFGFKKTSVDQVSNELHISKKTIYQHFDTKEEIFYYIVSGIARQYMKGMERKLAKVPTVEKKLSSLIRMIFAEARKWLKGNDAFEFRYKYEISELAFRDAYTELLQQLVQQGIEAGEFSPNPVDLTVHLIQGMISESMRLVTASSDLDVEDHLVKAILKVVH